MTPTLWGRWQTRTAMLLTWGVLISLIFAFIKGIYVDEDAGPFHEDFFWVLFTVLVLGWVWDIVWILLQRLRWDRDWPPAFVWGTAFVEGVLVWEKAYFGGLSHFCLLF